MADHPGRYRTLAKAQGNNFWRGMYRDIDDFVVSWDVCQKRKVDELRRQVEARAPSVTKYPFEKVHMDWITWFPPTAKGFDSILVFACALSDMVHLQAALTSDTSQVTDRHLINNVVRLYGLPKVLISFVYYESIKRELNKRLIFDSRCDERLNVKSEGCTRLTYTMWREEP